MSPQRSESQHPPTYSPPAAPTATRLLLTPSFALAQVSISTVIVTESGSSTTETVSFSKAEDALILYDPDPLDACFPTYDDTTGFESCINSKLNYRGLPILVTMRENQTSLTFTIDRLGITKTFNGATRDESAEQFYDFLISNGGSLLSRSQQELARVSPVDRFVGNPNSMQSQVISSLGAAGGFSTGSGLVFSAPRPTNTPSTSEYIPLSQIGRVTYLQSAGARGTQNSFNLSMLGGIFSAGDADGTAFSLPTGDTLRLDSYPGLSFDLGVPISYSEVDKSVTIGGIGALSLEVPLSDAWTIAPSIKYGVVDSVDLAATAQLAGAALTSTYAIPQGPGTVVVANMLSYVSTLPFDFGDIS